MYCYESFLFVLVFVQPALVVVKEIKQSAKRSLQFEDYVAALWKYQHAISICRSHELVEEEAIINANCAFVALKMEEGDQDEMMAYNYASRCIALKPDFEKVIAVSIYLM